MAKKGDCLVLQKRPDGRAYFVDAGIYGPTNLMHRVWVEFESDIIVEFATDAEYRDRYGLEGTPYGHVVPRGVVFNQQRNKEMPFWFDDMPMGTMVFVYELPVGKRNRHMKDAA